MADEEEVANPAKLPWKVVQDCCGGPVPHCMMILNDNGGTVLRPKQEGAAINTAMMRLVRAVNGTEELDATGERMKQRWLEAEEECAELRSEVEQVYREGDAVAKEAERYAGDLVKMITAIEQMAVRLEKKVKEGAVAPEKLELLTQLQKELTAIMMIGAEAAQAAAEKEAGEDEEAE